MKIIPIVILGVLSSMSLGLNLALHGKKRETKYNFWWDLISSVLLWGLLYWALQ